MKQKKKKPWFKQTRIRLPIDESVTEERRKKPTKKTIRRKRVQSYKRSAPFQCSICKKRFSKKTLWIHITWFIRETSHFKWTICSHRASDRSNLSQHICRNHLFQLFLFLFILIAIYLFYLKFYVNLKNKRFLKIN